MNRQPTYTQTIRTHLVTAMKHGEYASCDHLPPEKVLAENLGISRTQLRDVLAALEREGFITRRHGIGTVINHHVLNVRSRMDIETEFLDMIRQSGFEPAIAFVQVSESVAEKKIAESLHLEEDEPVIRVVRLCTADGKPAIYCEDVFSKRLIKKDYAATDLTLPIFHFLQQFCGVCAYMDLTNLRPVAADAALAEIFQVPPGTPLLNMDEVDFDIEGKPVFHSIQYFVDGIFQHTVLRKKL